MKFFGILAGALMVAATISGAVVAQSCPPQIPWGQNLGSYLVQWRCTGGAMPLIASCNSWPQKQSDLVFWRRADWGANGVPYYQISDSVLADDGNSIIQTWSYSPWRGFVQANGDGGQIAYSDGLAPYFMLTQDGGEPYRQYFVGPKCGGDGWIIANARLGILAGAWTSQVARLSISQDPSACPPLGQAYTRWMGVEV